MATTTTTATIFRNWAAFPPCHPNYPDCGHGRRRQADAVRSGKETVARRERSATRGHLSTPAVGARIGPLCQEQPQREGPRQMTLRWGVRLIRSRFPLSLLVRERRATGASPSAPRQEVKNRARWVGRNKRRRALGAGSSRILRHPRTLRRGVEHRRAAASAAGANELRVGRTAASPARRRARRPNTRERKKQLSTTT